eukprot:CAMPEP_0119303640 /NCGR_PEP_ID=MMETSP1333-20130426/5045_1 /TAXON_ID=418940 /ORGANISM="Scyphosphaera apsteinii, Strain RCC1455" /LENGTH=394 /DNA_ID=CAMNT_0007306371 /DNA_START=18 /DNA_END=1202 /DNA_ORIENTATION=-
MIAPTKVNLTATLSAMLGTPTTVPSDPVMTKINLVVVTVTTVSADQTFEDAANAAAEVPPLRYAVFTALNPQNFTGSMQQAFPPRSPPTVPPSPASPHPPSAPPSLSLPTSKASGDVHFQHASGSKFDIRGYHGAVFNLHQAANISLNARFTVAKYQLAPNDPRRVAIKAVNGSFITAVYAVLQSDEDRVYITYSGDSPLEANMLRLAREGTTGQETQETQETHVGIGTKIEFGYVCVDMIKDHPVKLIVSNAKWRYVVTPGTYVTTDRKHHTRLDIQVIARTDPMESAGVAPHGILGQGFDGVLTEGRRDRYVADDMGSFVTSAQGEGAIEGTIDDYLVKGYLTDPHATEFRFGRFGRRQAPPRNVSELVGKYVRESKWSRKAASSVSDGGVD